MRTFSSTGSNCSSIRNTRDLARQVVADHRSVSPETEVVDHEFSLKDPWDFEEVYGRLYDLVRDYDFQPEHEDYLIHLTTGTHVAQICWFLLNEAQFIPAAPPADLADPGKRTRCRAGGCLRDHRSRSLEI
jgi:transcriptional regulatory protein RtcR